MKPISTEITQHADQDYDCMLWKTFRNGDKDAYAMLYHRYFKFLVESSLRISSDKDLIKDCIHDLFVEIWKNKLNLDIPRSVKAYLCISIQRKIIRQVKKTRLWLSHSDFKGIMDTEIDYSIEKKIISEQLRLERQNSVYKAMDTLTKRQKEAVYLKFYANLSYPEIASKMAISTDSIYNLVSKAIDNMQVEMSKISMQ
ncbi:MAG: sigma-70 family RNA polymerase sigma factor [Bacteroidota bacterium]